jgi:hypothetical protein
VVELPQPPGCINDFQKLNETIKDAPHGSDSPADIVLCNNSSITFTESILIDNKVFNLICPDGSTCILDGQNVNQLFLIINDANIVFSGGIMFTNGKAGVSELMVGSQLFIVHAFMLVF